MYKHYDVLFLDVGKECQQLGRQSPSVVERRCVERGEREKNLDCLSTYGRSAWTD